MRSARFSATSSRERSGPGASPGAGTTNHLVSELLQQITGATWITVHYKGNAPATTDLLGGQVQANFDQVSVALPYIRQGRVRALAITMAKRFPSLPDVPTFEEAGVKGIEAATFTGVLAPVNTPRDIVEAVANHLSQRPDVRHVPIEEARTKMGPYADALALDQKIRSARARALGWHPSLRSVSGNVARLLEEFRNARS